MLNKENKDKCWMLLSKYGCEAQMMMVIEECSELSKAVCKVLRYPDNYDADANFREELIDVEVMLQQMFLMLHISNDEINERAKKKMDKALGV